MDTPILGMLAATEWFARRGEVVLTTGLAFCLEKDPAAGKGLLDLLSERAGVIVDAAVTWRAEAPAEDGRVDIDGLRRGTRVPVVRIEGKVSAAFADRQVSAYAKDQLAKLEGTGGGEGVLAVVVPESRLRTVIKEVGDAVVTECGAAPDGPRWVIGTDTTVSVCVVSWDDVLRSATATARTAREDLCQLLGACRVLDGADVGALTEADLAGEWVTRAEDIQKIVYRVTELAGVRLGQLRAFPEQRREPFEGAYRYLGKDSAPAFAVGRRTGDQTHPVWAAWLPQAARDGVIEDRLRAGGWSPVVDDAGYLWVPLHIDPLPADRPATQQIVQMAEEAERLWRAARASEATLQDAQV